MGRSKKIETKRTTNFERLHRSQALLVRKALLRGGGGGEETLTVAGRLLFLVLETESFLAFLIG